MQKIRVADIKKRQACTHRQQNTVNNNNTENEVKQERKETNHQQCPHLAAPHRPLESSPQSWTGRLQSCRSVTPPTNLLPPATSASASTLSSLPLCGFNTQHQHQPSPHFHCAASTPNISINPLLTSTVLLQHPTSASPSTISSLPLRCFNTQHQHLHQPFQDSLPLCYLYTHSLCPFTV